MTTKKRVTIEVEVEELDRLFDTDEFRLELARYVQRDWVEAGAMRDYEAAVTKIRVDGVAFLPDEGTFEPGPITAEVAQLIMDGRKILAIKMIRENTLCSLIEAKEAVDNWAANR